MVDRIDIMNTFIKPQFLSKRDILKSNENLNHAEILKNFKNFGIMSKYDYSRACGNENFTDFYDRKAGRKINKYSKYNIIRPSKNGGNIYLTCNLDNVLNELNERYIQKSGSCYDLKNCRLKGHFINDNILRFGTKKDNYFYVNLEAADLNKLLKKEYYYLPEISHTELQIQISNLGYFLGFSSKVARGEKDLDVKGRKTVEIATVFSLDLNDFQISKCCIDEVDFIDVIWFENKKIIAGFEVELSKNWHGVLDRFINLCHVAKKLNQTVYCIIVSYGKYEDMLRNKFLSSAYTSNFENSIFKFLPLERFIDFIPIKHPYCTDPGTFRRKFNNLLIDLSPLH